MQSDSGLCPQLPSGMLSRTDRQKQNICFKALFFASSASHQPRAHLLEERYPRQRYQELGSLVWAQGSRRLFGTESCPLAAWAEKKECVSLWIWTISSTKVGTQLFDQQKKPRHHVSGLNSRVANCSLTNHAIRKGKDNWVFLLP